MNEYENLKKGEQGAWISICAYLILSATKLIIASIGQSEALRADGLNNVTDVIASLAVLIGLRISRKPPDKDHHYGHFRAETIGSLIAAFIMMTVGLQVIYETIQQIFAGQEAQPSLLTAWTAAGAAVVMYGVYLYNLRLSKRINSHSLYAAAQDNRSDALVSIGAFIGIIGAQFGAFWLDPVAGFIVGLIICKTAYDIFRDASHTLTDGVNEELLDQVKETLNQDSDVKVVEDVKARLHGNQVLVDATILVDPELSVQQGHDITDRLEDSLADEHGIYHTHIHIEPYHDEDHTQNS
ncbi:MULTISPECIES: cation diffusion facilitator family transporter [Pontibacillus]|uniref:Cation diffusion facilitator family transporter n=1 Tax=Pontibacillus chungwhensis TaxID=265426 RepID=A0ABY8V269_9BACI|nr:MULTISPECIES: cation diffusion facilitator family transporter [Pontibacillus]MCD5324920.1 cation diffusion facilitator family transporter [Pontibacillus sp. HN14]WIF98879.1 cation diffusion facilitator family transporter [Pontibacillus chungwhensis]